jgi:hypothetical protein
MDEKKLNELVDEVSTIDLVNDRIEQVGRDNKLTEKQIEELRDNVWRVI